MSARVSKSTRLHARAHLQQCRGKIGYPSKRAAGGVARVMVQTGRSKLMRVYKCDGCRQWHVGNDRHR